MKNTLIACLILLFANCKSKNQKQPEMKVYTTTGTIEKFDDALDSLVAPGALPEIIAEGFEWSEGPLWVPVHNMLLFSDVPKNAIYKWTEQKGKEVYLSPSGYTGSIERGGEMGSNGLLLDHDGRLVLCQHGNRQMARMIPSTDKPAPEFEAIATHFQGKRFSSPNDAVYDSHGDLYFTDPPYGLLSQDDQDSEKEIPFNGVYKVKKNGEIMLLVESISRPNGLAFLPGGKKLIIACSDPAIPYWYIYDVAGDSLVNEAIFYSAAGYDKSEKGLPDGLKVDPRGNVFATGPGGIWIFNGERKLLGKIKLPGAASNVAFSADGKTLYITNDNFLLRIRLRE